MRRPTRCVCDFPRSVLENLERRQLLNAAFDLAVNFQPAGAPVPSGFVVDSGQAFGNRGNGFSYGWDAANNSTRDRNRIADQSRDTLIHLQREGNFTWELAVPNGEYQVELVAGDADFFDSVFRVNVEGAMLLSGTPTSANRFVGATGTVNVSDGRLTVTSGDGAINNKLALIRVTQPSSNPNLLSAKVNFQTPTSPTPSGFLADTGSVFGSRGNGFSFGWNTLNSSNARDRNTLADQSFDTLTHLQRGGDFVWEMAVPNGRYAVSLTAGDPDFFDGTFRISVEGSLGLSGSPTSSNRFVTGSTTVDVTDGRITVRSADGAINNKLNFIEIQQLDDGGPVVPPPPPPPATSPIRINFQPDGRPVPDFYRVDTGAAYGPRANGLTYGWSGDNIANARDRNTLSDQRYDTFNHMQKGGDFAWEYALPNGTYTVRVVAGESDFFDSTFRINVEGTLAVSGSATSASRFVEGTVTVNVSDGRLTITNGSGAVNNKIAFVEIIPADASLPVISVNATAGSATEGGASGNIRFVRTGSTSSALTLNYTVGGSAGNGTDVQALSGSITIPAGAAFADLPIVAVDDTLAESEELLTVSLAASASYSSTLANVASVRIIDNDSPTSFNNVVWTRAVTPPVSYAEWQSIEHNGSVYLFGGFTGTFRPVDDTWRFDPATNSFTQLAPMPNRLTHAQPASVGNKIYLVGGYVGRDPTGQIFGTDNVYIYDIPSNSWSFGPKLPAIRAAGNLVAVGTKLHYFGGQNLARTLDTPDHWVLDTANLAAGWTRLASMPIARNHAAALNIDGQIWVFGGQTGYDNNLVTRREVFRYDPPTNTWTTMSWQLPEGRSHTGYSTHYARGRVIMVAGERAHNSIVRTVWSIDVNAGTVASLNLFPEARISPAGAFVGGRLWMAGGYNNGIRTDAYWGDFI